MLDDEVKRNMYTRYVNFQQSTPTTVPRPPKSTASPTVTPGPYTEKLLARKGTVSARYTSEEPIASSAPAHHSTASTPVMPSVRQHSNAATGSDAAIIAALTASDTQGKQTISQSNGVSFFPTIAEADESVYSGLTFAIHEGTLKFVACVVSQQNLLPRMTTNRAQTMRCQPLPCKKRP